MIWLSYPTHNSSVVEHSARLWLNIHRGKNKILKVNSISTASVTLGVEVIEEVEHFTCLGSVVDTQGGTEADVKARIGKAKMGFLQMKNISKSSVLSLKNKITIFNTNVEAVLLYGAET